MKSETYSILSQYNNVTDVSSSVKNFCLSNDIDENKSNDIVICLIEALNNVIKHSYKEEFDRLIEVKVLFDGKMIFLEITDDGIKRTNFEKPILDFDPNDIESLPEGGMGLFVIDNLMDKTIYKSENGKNTFIMTKVL